MSELAKPSRAGTALMPSQVIENQRTLSGRKNNPPPSDVTNASKQTAICQPPTNKQETSHEEILGTHLATYSKATGAGASLVKPVRVKRKSSTAISLRDAENLIAATRFAERIGLPLVRFTTVHLGAAGIADPVKAIGRLLKLMGDWLRVNGGAFAYVATREAGGSKGEHVHLLLHVPADLRAGFNRRQSRWLRAIGARRARGVIVSKPVGRSYFAAHSNLDAREHYADNLAGTLAYLLKGAEPDALELLALPRAEPGGELHGKRCFHSENIGRAARARGSLTLACPPH
jgi:hypothetical protein